MIDNGYKKIKIVFFLTLLVLSFLAGSTIGDYWGRKVAYSKGYWDGTCDMIRKYYKNDACKFNSNPDSILGEKNTFPDVFQRPC